MEINGVVPIRQNDISINKSNEFIDEHIYRKNDADNNDTVVSKHEFERAIGKLNKFLEDDNVHAEYDIHDKFGDVMIKIVDNNTKEIIMEVPPKKVLDMVAKLCELSGVILDKKV